MFFILFLGHILVCACIIVLLPTPAVLADGLLQESEWQQASSDLQNSFEYSGRF